MSESTALRVRVECLPYAADADNPVRLVVADGDGKTVAELKFTPTRASDVASSAGRIISCITTDTEAERLNRGLRNAAIRVWATRN